MAQRTACTSILIGKKATADGSIIIGRNEDSKSAWPKHFVKYPARQTAARQTFVSKANGFTMILPQKALGYTATPEWTDEYGIFAEDGINEAGVAMSATESAYANARVSGLDPFVENGVSEEAMVTVILPYISSAQQGITRLGEIVTTSGASEANGILFADHEEAWYMEILTGHHWVAQRIPDDHYAVIANQLAIQEVIPGHDDFRYDDTLFEFARRHHLYDPNTAFNSRQIFGTAEPFDQTYNTPRVWDGQRQLSPSIAQEPTDLALPFIQRPDRKLFSEDAMQVLSSHFNGTIYDPVGTLGDAHDRHRFRPISLAKTQEAHVLQLRPVLPYAVADIHWLAMGVAAESQFVPFFAGLTDTPLDYQRGSLPPSLDSAYWQYKLTSVLMDAHYHRFERDLAEVQKKTHAKLRQLIVETDTLAQQREPEALKELATQQSCEAAEIAKKAWQIFQMQLLQNSTDLSPLNFTTDDQL